MRTAPSLRLGWRVAVFVAAVAAAACSIQHEWFIRTRELDARQAYILRSYDPIALGVHLDQHIVDSGRVEIRPADVGHIVNSLRHEPLNRNALRFLGLRREQEGRLDQADKAMALADRVSRRDGATQVWLIERAAQTGDIPGALVHYNAALSVRSALAPTLFPVLRTATADAAIRRYLRPYIAPPSLWAFGFLHDAIAHGDPRDVAALLMPLGMRVGTPAYDDINAELLTALAGVGAFDTADRYTLRVLGIPSGQISPLGFTAMTTDRRLGALGWKTPFVPGVEATPDRSGGLRLLLAPFAEGVVASRVIPIEGTHMILHYRLRGDAGTREIRWAATCSGPGGATIMERTEISRPGSRAVAYALDLPPRCTGLRLTIAIAPADDGTRADLTLSDLRREHRGRTPPVNGG